MSNLEELIQKATDGCMVDGVCTSDDRPGGAVHQWVLRNCKMRPGTEFFVVLFICLELEDRDAQRDGYEDQLDRACVRLQRFVSERQISK